MADEAPRLHCRRLQDRGQKGRLAKLNGTGFHRSLQNSGLPQRCPLSRGLPQTNRVRLRLGSDEEAGVIRWIFQQSRIPEVAHHGR
jgi:hypothetical protein